MIVLDTNVLSELMRPSCAPAVHDWVSRQPRRTLYTTAITEAEIYLGLKLLPLGAKRSRLESAAAAVLDEDFRGRILAFDRAVAANYADIVAGRRRKGRPIEPLDAQIAATTRVAKAKLATRNIDDFKDCGIELIDPWTARR